MTAEQRELLCRAAEAQNKSLSAFVLNGACQAAEQLLRDQAPVAPAKEAGSLPTFTEPARQRWESIPAHIRQRLLTKVWCGPEHEGSLVEDMNADEVATTALELLDSRRPLPRA